jgi:hypothetical protein
MDTNSFSTVLITAITVLGSARAWSYYEKKALFKERNDNYMKDDCRDRIVKLEQLLEKSSSEKDEMRSTILNLSSQVAELRVKVEYLESENDELIKAMRKKRNINE